MSIENQLKEELKQAMRDRDQETANTIRMIKTKVMEAQTAGKERAEVNDALYETVIAAYHKQMKKALAEYEKLGERGAEEAEKLRGEVAFCQRFLPEQMSDDALESIVAEALEATGVTDPKQAGRVVGHVMKSHKGKVDAARIKSVIESKLS